MLRAAKVLVIGVGGMAVPRYSRWPRSGIGSFAIADIDTFEVSNFNRQVFADLDTVDQQKAEATAVRLRRINPEIALEVAGADWMRRIDDLLQRYPVVINGMDDIGAGIELYRRARKFGATVVDAYTSPCPRSRVRPPKIRAELAWEPLVDARRPPRCRHEACFMRKRAVLVHSSPSTHRQNPRSWLPQAQRMRFAPMVTPRQLIASSLSNTAPRRRWQTPRLFLQPLAFV